MYQEMLWKKHNKFITDRRGRQKALCSYEDFSTFLYDHILYHGRKYFCRCLEVLNTAEILKHHIKDCFKINGKQRI